MVGNRGQTRRQGVFDHEGIRRDGRRRERQDREASQEGLADRYRRAGIGISLRSGEGSPSRCGPRSPKCGDIMTKGPLLAATALPVVIAATGIALAADTKIAAAHLPNNT